MKKMRHVMLLLPSSALAETFDQQDSLQHPQVGFCGKSSIGKNLGPKDVMNAYLVELADFNQTRMKSNIQRLGERPSPRR